MRDESLDPWIGRLNAGDSAAVEQVLLACEPSLRIAIRRRLGRELRSKVDSVDIVQSVFADVLAGFRKGGWQFADREHFFAFLRRIAWRRLADRYEKHKQTLGREQSLRETLSGMLPASAQPRPSQVAQGHEFLDRVLQSCPPAHQEVVRLRMIGMQMGEIASRTGLHEGSVRRILYDLARRMSIARRSDSRPLEEPEKDAR